MSLMPLAVVEGWQFAVNARDIDQLCALSSRDVELVGPRGSGRGYEVLRQWLGRAGFTASISLGHCAGFVARAVTSSSSSAGAG